MKDLKPSNTQEPHLWLASDLMKHLDYRNTDSFMHHVAEAVSIMILLEIPYYINVIPLQEETAKKKGRDFQLSRFACYLVVMLSDRKKIKVADARKKFTRKAVKYGIRLEDTFELERLKIREELSEAGKWLNSTASKSGVTDFSSFNDAGYLGLYTMHSRQLNNWRKLPDTVSQQDYMGRTELAANLLRITLTEQSIRNQKIKGQESLENTHLEVGSGIRKLIKTHTGKNPEQLPVYKELDLVKKQLREGYQKMIETK